jgi:hypothetical protein
MKFKHRIIAMAAAVGLSGALTLAVGIVPAAASQQICGDYGSGYCLNDWGNGGVGNPVKMYYGSSSNEDFYVQPIDRCAGGDHVTATCPFSSQSLDSDLIGMEIVQVQYAGGGCIATTTGVNNAGAAVIGNCNKVSTGSGGSDGTVDVIWYDSLANIYWSNNGVNGDLACLQSGGNPGVQATYLIEYAGEPGCTPWGGL